MGTAWRVADFFCGAGGFSEGFRQAGFKIVFGLDNWTPAADTFKFNHQNAIVLNKDILSLDAKVLDSVVPDTEIIIGSPPCVAFSNSNKSGNGDKTLGLSLINKLLQIVAIKKNKKASILKYWILENVPKSSPFIKDEYTFDELGLDGGKRIALKVEKKQVLNSADFGTPQSRKRFFCGVFPNLMPTHLERDWMTLGHVKNALGSPSETRRAYIQDPNYGFRIPVNFLTDHHYDTPLARFEWTRAKKLKIDHGFMGKMSFPENEGRPSRTIMATQSTMCRESMIFASDKGGYRLPTIREAASLMSFPITYQFIGKDAEEKHRLVGNAVCPKESNAIAESILKIEVRPPGSIPNPHSNLDKMLVCLPFKLDGTARKIRKRKARSIKSRFRGHVPFLRISGYRIDLDNLASNFTKQKIRWRSTIHHGTGKDALKARLTKEPLIKLLEKDANFRTFQNGLESEVIPKLPANPLVFQQVHCGIRNSYAGPSTALENIKKLVDEHYPSKRCGKKYVINDDMVKMKKEKIPLRIVAAAFAVSAVAEKVNERTG